MHFIIPTKYTRDVPVSSDSYAWIHRTSEDTWEVGCTAGPVFLLNRKEHGWRPVTAIKDHADYEFSFKEAMAALEIVLTVKEATTYLGPPEAL